MSWKIEAVPELTGYTIEWAAPGNYYLSRRNRIFHSTRLAPPFTEIARIDAPFWKEKFSGVRLAQRLLRFMATNVIPLDENGGELFVTFDKTVGIIKNGNFQPLKNLARPCRVLRAACAVNQAGDIFFGEYLANRERGEMRVYCRRRGSDALETVYVFPPRSIKHIHGLYFDRFTNSIFCLTGDDEKECRILRTTDEFQTLETVGEGDETWRAVSILFTENAFFYGTDAEFRANCIYRVERETLARKILGQVSGTVFYSKQLGDDLFFTTTAENAPSQTENVAALWRASVGGEELEKIAAFRKDRWHAALFQFGTIHFPFENRLENELYFHLVGVVEDNRTFRLSRN
jgi:hypothetical protein